MALPELFFHIEISAVHEYINSAKGFSLHCVGLYGNFVLSDRWQRFSVNHSSVVENAFSREFFVLFST